MGDQPASGATWGEIPAARDRVIALLHESGAPLEAQIAQVCKRFVTVYDGHGDMIVQTEPLIYGTDDDRPLREVDQLLTLYQELSIGDDFGIQLILFAPIEAKHRKDIQLFGIEVGEVPIPHGALPVGGDLAKSNLFRNEVAVTLPSHMNAERLRRIAAISFKDTSTPQSVFKENLLYNASASLYDFILESAASFSSGSTISAMEHEGALVEFDTYTKEKNYTPQYVAREWVTNLPQERFLSYAHARRGGGGRLYRTVDIYCPIVCVNSPMHAVELDALGDIKNFAPKDILLTSARVAGWTSRGTLSFALRGPEAVTTVTSLKGLEGLLLSLLDFFGNTRGLLANMNVDSCAQAMFEHDFLKAIGEMHLSTAGTYRSDIDLDL